VIGDRKISGMAYEDEDIIVVRTLALFAAALTWQGTELPTAKAKRSEAVTATADKYVAWILKGVTDGR
jgi:hypothetical protein